jgi:hypothetical protein
MDETIPPGQERPLSAGHHYGEKRIRLRAPGRHLT